MRAVSLLKVSLTVLSYCALIAHSSGYYTPSNHYKWKYHHRKGLADSAVGTTTTEKSSANDLHYYRDLKLRHHSRFPNLDRVMTKLDQGKGRQPQRTTTAPTTTERDLFEDYGDLIDVDGKQRIRDAYEDELKDDDDFDDDYEDEDVQDDEEEAIFNGDDDWQAEEASEQPIQPPARTQPISALSKYKWDHYGTRAKVEESRRAQLSLRPTNEQTSHEAAVGHYIRVLTQGECRKPQMKVIPVKSEYPDLGKTYTPHCTILHRCAEDTGCCSNYNTRCGPKKQVPVHLYFYAKTLGEHEAKVERLMFYNHTECECIQKSKQKISNSSTENYHRDTSAISSEIRTLSRRPEDIRKCRCPQEFTPIYRYTSCSCDCDDDNQDCLRMKEGKEYIGMSDRMCIVNSQCGVPSCEFGVYLPQKGRCQKEREKLESYRKISIQ